MLGEGYSDSMEGKVEVLRSHFFPVDLIVSYQTEIWLKNYDG